MSTASNHIFIIAHAPLAHALRDCAVHVFNDCAAFVTVLDVAPQESPDVTLANAQALLAHHERSHTLVLTDVLGATPSNVAHRLVADSAAHLLVGVNLPMLLRAICYRHEALDVLASKALVGGQQGMLHVGVAPVI